MKKNNKNFLPLMLPSILLLLVCLLVVGSSPLFRTNPWDDSNAMLTMGRSLINGVVPYKDIIDQRGPFLYALFALGATLKSTSFLGVFVIQIVNVFVIYWLSIKIAIDLKLNKKNAIWIGLLGPFSLLSTSSFSFSGSPEEFAFTSVMYLLYVVNHYHQDVASISPKKFFFVGVNLSLVFWNKYSMIGAFVIFFFWVFIAMMRQQKFFLLFKIILISIAGFFSVSLLVLLYFSFHNALHEIINIYFIQNMTAYGKSDQSSLMRFWNLFFLVAKEIRTHFIVILLIILGWLSLILKKQNLVGEVSIFSGTLFFVALQHWVINYYNLIWMPFFGVALIRLFALILERKSDTRIIDRQSINAFSLNLLIVSALIIFPFVNNLDLTNLILKRESRSIANNSLDAQTKFAQLINEKKTGSHQPSLIMINSLDKGFFLASRTLPVTPFFHRLNMSYDQLPQMYDSFNNDMKLKKTDFVIVKIKHQLAKNNYDLHSQVDSVIDSHLRYSLKKNYWIKAEAQNSLNESYVLFAKR